MQEDTPIRLIGTLNGSALKHEWDSPLFKATVEATGMFSAGVSVETREGHAAMNALIGYVLALPMSPFALKNLAQLTWPEVKHGNCSVGSRFNMGSGFRPHDATVQKGFK